MAQCNAGTSSEEGASQCNLVSAAVSTVYATLRGRERLTCVYVAVRAGQVFRGCGCSNMLRGILAMTIMCTYASVRVCMCLKT